jgi:hypothetical protein
MGGGSYTKCFWDSDVNPDVNGIGNTTDPNVIGESTANMRIMSTFTDAGWDFVDEVINGANDIWMICERQDYPRLWWEEVDCGAYSGGSGTPEDPHRIWTAEDMQAIGTNPGDWDEHFMLMTDIDLGAYTGTAFNMIGSWGTPFSGVFDGNNHTISNFTYSSSGGSDVGLFIYVDGEIRNLGLAGVNVDGGSDSVGALVTFLDGSVSDCWVQGGNVSGGHSAGGLAGDCWDGVMSNCQAEVNVSGVWGVGGIAGLVAFGSVSNCHSACSVSASDSEAGVLVGEVGGASGTVSHCSTTGTVTVGNRSAGGLVGSNRGMVCYCYSTSSATGDNEIGGLVGRHLGVISNCYAMGEASGNSQVGGLVGLYWDTDSNDGDIINSYSVGSVSGGSVGGLVGYNIDDSGSVTNSFWDVNSSGVGVSDGGAPKTTAEMQTQSTFTSAGWDFVGEVINGANDIWYCDEPNYPQLAWEVALSASIDMDETWMYQSVAGQSNSDLTASVSVTDDPMGNSTYSYAWEIVLAGDVNLAPVTVDGGGAGDAYWTFAARGCDEPGSLSDSGQTFTVRVTVTGDDYGNTGQAEGQFGIALLGDINNDGVVNVADRSIANAFWRAGSAGPYMLRDCDVNCDGVVNVADRSIANAVWRGLLGQNAVSTPCPLR